MSLATAIRDGDVAELPGKRDEDWRWTDLRGLIRAVPEPSEAVDVDTIGVGVFDELAGEHIGIANGRIAASGGPELAHELEAHGYDRYAA